MKNLERKLRGVVADYVNDYGYEGLFEELFPHQDIEDIVIDMYNSGLIPEDRLEDFLNDE